MCGVFGIHGHDEAANIAYLGLHALQHRGQESAGLVAVDDGRLRRHASMGLVSDAFSRDTLSRLPGSTAIGHVRYSTAGSSELRNAQPFVFEYAGGQLAIAHNGNIVNANELRAELDASGSIFQTSSDTEVIVHLMAKAREQLGMRLAQESPVAADVVIPVPDSGVPAAIGYANESKIPFEMGLIRSHYVGRTFIEPQDSIRHFGVRLKLSVVRQIVDGKRVVVVDDSLVRGTTSRKIVKMLRNAGAREVHLRISAPPTTHPCFYGIDTPTRSELVAASHTIEEIGRYVTCDSIAYLSHAGMMSAIAAPEKNETGAGYCSACFTGKYPVALGTSELVQLRRARV